MPESQTSLVLITESALPASLKLNELRLFCALFCVYFAYSILRNLPELLRWYASHRGLFPGRKILGIWRPFQPPPAALASLLAVLALTLLVNAISPSRLWVALAIVLYFSTFPGLTDFHLVGHAKSSLAPLTLLVLLLSSEAYSRPFLLQTADVASGGVSGSWPLVAIRLLIAVVYFSLGVEKLLASGWSWASGRALRWYLIEHYAWGAFRPARHLINRPALLRVLSTVTLGLQLLAPLIVLGGWLPAVHGVVAVGFHLSTRVFMGIHFLPFFGPIVVSSALSYPLSRLCEASLGPEHPLVAGWVADAPPLESSVWQVASMLLIVAAQVACQVARRYRFPFLPYQLFSGDFSDFRRPGILLLEIGDAEGNYAPWRPRHYYDVRDVSHLGYDLALRRTRLSSALQATFRFRYWPVMRRESSEGGSRIASVRLVWRFAAWRGDAVVRYDDFAIGEIPIVDGQVGDLRLLDPKRLRSCPL